MKKMTVKVNGEKIKLDDNENKNRADFGKMLRNAEQRIKSGEERVTVSFDIK